MAAVRREYLVLAGVVALLSGGSALAFWAGAFTTPRLQIKEATCASMQVEALKTFHAAPSAPWRPPGVIIASLGEPFEGPNIRNERGDVTERRCRAPATLADGRRARFSYKMFEDETGALARVGGLDGEGEIRVFRRN